MGESEPVITNPITMIRVLNEAIAESETLLREITALTTDDRAELLAGIERLQGDIDKIREFLISYDGIPPE